MTHEPPPRQTMGQLSHFDPQGASRMVDVGGKPATRRMARASGRIRMAASTLKQIHDQATAKGNVWEVARLAGIMAAKQTSGLIPLCHPLPLDSVRVSFEVVNDETVRIESQVQATASTGAEMEALTAVSIAALTVYDMCKSIDRGMVIEQVQLEEKSGGQRGHYRREA